MVAACLSEAFLEIFYTFNVSSSGIDGDCAFDEGVRVENNRVESLCYIWVKLSPRNSFAQPWFNIALCETNPGCLCHQIGK